MTHEVFDWTTGSTMFTGTKSEARAEARRLNKLFKTRVYRIRERERY